MAIEHLRNLAKYGVINDVDPYDLAPEAFSAGVNVRFRNGKITGAPVFRSVLHVGTTDPRFVFSSNPTAGLDLLFIGYMNGTVSRITGTTESAASITGYTPSAVEATWSSTTLANVTYVNRSDRAPWYIRPSDSIFQNLGVASGSPTSWDSTWSCTLLRTCAGALVALNVTKGATNSPTMVKTSSIPLAGAIPTSWDQTLPNTLATENILSELQGPITDGCKFGEGLIIYGFKQAYHMYANGQSSVYTYDPLPFKKGSLNANCSIEFDGKNVVFGPDDIWQHDGVSEKSICDQKTRDYIFGSLNLSKASRCFATHNPKLNEITFSYVSGDPLIAFIIPDGCNRQAVWNYANDTWTYDDLPCVYSATQANLSNPLTYAAVTATYDSFGGSYQDQEDGYKRTTVYVGALNATYGLSTSLYAFDNYGTGSTVAFPVDTAATKPRYLERDGIDLDELNVDLKGYKTLASIYPQVRLGSGAANLMINAGSSDSFNVPATFPVGYQPYNGADLNKLDFNVAGRYLSLRIQFADYKEITIAGFDLDIKVTAKRG
jgi:hypothetical protein